MLAILAGIGVLMVVDRPSPSVVAEVEPSRPSRRMPLATPEIKAGGQMDVADVAVPDLFTDHAIPAVHQQAQGNVIDGKNDALEQEFGLLGFKEENGRREAFLMRNGEVLIARAGAVFEKRYRVMDLQKDSVLIRDNQSGQEIRIGFRVNQ
ncbi:hypothetical protein H8L32_07395 [Undibacterium sp. CY18W]|uniref:Uncharacterized protein n=1 Tax=Undibacterium hunanense TaxID=2762292 RepID=A0ABR6ZNX8_9BURK|nr:hypothetical protein [Undibacterium hunanense]MBC3917294.1 hypothetical protein [Undibacterium hunanense]